MSILEPDFKVMRLSDVGKGSVVRYSPDGNEDVYAITALHVDRPALVVLDGSTYVSERQNSAVVAVLKEWRIEPEEISVAGAHRELEVGTILVWEDEVGCLVDTDNHPFLSFRSFEIGELPQVQRRVAVTKWRLWIPQFSDGYRPAWKTIFDFPSKSASKA